MGSTAFQSDRTTPSVTNAGPSHLGRLLHAVLMMGTALDLQALLHRIVEAAVELVDARYGALGVLEGSGDRFAEFIAVGVDADTQVAIGDLPKGLGLLGSLMVNDTPLRIARLGEHPDSVGFPPNHPPMTSFLGVAIRVCDVVYANLYLTAKTTGEAFTAADEELALCLAAAAGVAIENARLYERQRVMVVEDQERIGRDLHDTVIQRLFATGLALQGAARLVTDASVHESIGEAVGELDRTIAHIRAVIFGVQSSNDERATGVRAQILEIAHNAGRGLGFQPRTVFNGSVDATVGGRLRADLLATVEEVLSNVVRHAYASSVDLELSVDEAVALVIVDDGIGMPAGSHYGHGHGMANIRARAEGLGGTLDVNRHAGGGTEVHWRVPLLAR